jgi:DNA-binding LytR/AlgR family response regulator
MKAVIIEDEMIIAKELQDKIEAIAEDVNIVEVLPSLKTARKWFMQNAEPDLIFMDIQLSDGVSFELFNTYTLHCPVVFTTAYDEYALRAFRVNGADYLLKPVDTEDLKKAIDKCRRIVESNTSVPLDIQQLIKNLRDRNLASLYKEKFIVNVRNNWIPVNTTDIACFTRDTLNYLYTFSGDKYVLDFTTLEEIEDLLDPQKFYRANRQFIIHIDSIQSVKPHENAKLTVSLKAPLKLEVDISREKAPTFKKWFDK